MDARDDESRPYLIWTKKTDSFLNRFRLFKTVLTALTLVFHRKQYLLLLSFWNVCIREFTCCIIPAIN